MITVHIIDKEAVSRFARRELTETLSTEQEARAALVRATAPQYLQETLGLIETPVGYLLVRDDGVHSSEPCTLHQTFPFRFDREENGTRDSSSASIPVVQATGGAVTASRTEDEISVAKLLCLTADYPVHLDRFLWRRGGSVEGNYFLLLETLSRCGVDAGEIEAAKAARTFLAPHGSFPVEGHART